MKDTNFNIEEKILSEWKRLITMQEESIKEYRRTKNEYMEKFTIEVLKVMREDYEKLCKKFKAS